MFTKAIVLSLLTTFLMCFFIILSCWVVDCVGAVTFAILLIVNSVTFMLVYGGKDRG